MLDDAGHDALHLRDCPPPTATDEMVMQLARDQGRIVISADTDFGTLLARQNATTPSVLLVRRLPGRRVGEMAGIIIANLDVVAEDLRAGAVVVLAEESVRIRRLPVLPR